MAVPTTAGTMLARTTFMLPIAGGTPTLDGSSASASRRAVFRVLSTARVVRSVSCIEEGGQTIYRGASATT